MNDLSTDEEAARDALTARLLPEGYKFVPADNGGISLEEPRGTYITYVPGHGITCYGTVEPWAIIAVLEQAKVLLPPDAELERDRDKWKMAAIAEKTAIEMLARGVEAKNETIAILRGQVRAFSQERNSAEGARQRAVTLKKQAEKQAERQINRCQELLQEIVYLQKELQRCRESMTQS